MADLITTQSGPSGLTNPESTSGSTEPGSGSFEDYNLSTGILKGIYSIGWTEPSSTQLIGLNPMLQSRDVLLQAQSGTGKTGTFIIGLLHKIVTSMATEDPEATASIQGLIIAPTIELAVQIHSVLRTLGLYLNLNYLLCIGGKPFRDVLLHPTCPTIIVGTPGKLEDVICSRKIKSQPFNLKMFIVDEFDKTLNDDFTNILKAIYNAVVIPGTQIALISATVNDHVLEIADKILQDPIRILLNNEDVSLKGLNQFFIDVTPENPDDKFLCSKNKFDTIIDIYNSITVGQCVIFFNSIDNCKHLYTSLLKQNFTVDLIHGTMEKSERELITEQFRTGKIRILLATDILARGFDVQTVSLVINYDVPRDPSQYIHRIGRTARFGRKGISISFIGNTHDKRNIMAIEEYYKCTIKDLPHNFAELF